MSYKTFIDKIVIVDTDLQTSSVQIEAADEGVAKVTLKDMHHTPESWEELSREIYTSLVKVCAK